MVHMRSFRTSKQIAGAWTSTDLFIARTRAHEPFLFWLRCVGPTSLRQLVPAVRHQEVIGFEKLPGF
jgi:hypothetical protein